MSDNNLYNINDNDNENANINFEKTLNEIPSMLERDWNMNFKNVQQKEIAKKIFELKYAPANPDIQNKNNPGKAIENENYAGVYFNGKISFSLNWKKISILDISVQVIDFIQYQEFQSISVVPITMHLLNKIANIALIKDGCERCVVLKILALSKNKRSIPATYEQLATLFKKNIICTHFDKFPCEYMGEKNKCTIEDKALIQTFTNLVDKHVIRYENISITTPNDAISENSRFFIL